MVRSKLPADMPTSIKYADGKGSTPEVAYDSMMSNLKEFSPDWIEVNE